MAGIQIDGRATTSTNDRVCVQMKRSSSKDADNSIPQKACVRADLNAMGVQLASEHVWRRPANAPIDHLRQRYKFDTIDVDVKPQKELFL